jgi:hypothetical protein
MSDDKKLKRKREKFYKTADQISKNQSKRRAGEDVNQNQQDRKFRKMDKTLKQIDEIKANSSSNYGTMTPNNMGAPNFYVMNPGSPNKKMDTPGGFSYKAESTMNKLGFADSGINDGHSGINTGTEKEKKYDEFGTEIPDYGRHSDTGKEYIISPKANLVEKGKQTLQGPSSSSTIWSSEAKKPKSQRKVAEYTGGTTFHSTRKNKKGENVTVRRVMGDTERTRDKKLPTSYFKENKVYNVETPYTREVLTEKKFPKYSKQLLNKKKKK